MEIVLLKDVKRVGKAHEVVEVASGHALHYLIPQKFAVAATPAARKEAELRRQQAAARQALDEKLIGERLAALAEGAVLLRKKANEQGHLYDAVDARLLAEAAGLPEEAIRLEKPIKELGRHQIPVAHGETFGEFTLSIEAE